MNYSFSERTSQHKLHDISPKSNFAPNSTRIGLRKKVKPKRIKDKLILPSIALTEGSQTDRAMADSLLKDYTSFDAFDDSPIKSIVSSRKSTFSQLNTDMSPKYSTSSFRMSAKEEIYPSLFKAAEHIDIGRKAHSSMQKVVATKRQSFQLKNMDKVPF